MKLKVDPDIAKLFEGLEKWTYEALKKDIQENGIHDPLIVAEDGTIVCGNQRFKIAQELDLNEEEIPIVVRHFVNKQEMMEFAINDNLLRRNMSTYQKGLLGLRYFDWEKKAAHERMGTRIDLLDETSVKKFTNVRGRADMKAAERVGISHTTLRYIQYIEENAPEGLKRSAKLGKMSIYAVYREIKGLNNPKQSRSTIRSSSTRRSITRTLVPKMHESGDYFIEVNVPSDWYQGVKVAMKPTEKVVTAEKDEKTEEETTFKAQKEFRGLLSLGNALNTRYTRRGALIQIEEDSAYLMNKDLTVALRLKFNKSLGYGTFYTGDIKGPVERASRSGQEVILKWDVNGECKKEHVNNEGPIRSIVNRAIEKDTVYPYDYFRFPLKMLNAMKKDVLTARLSIKNNRLFMRFIEPKVDGRISEISTSLTGEHSDRPETVVFTRDLYALKGLVDELYIYLGFGEDPLSIIGKFNFGARFEGIISHMIYELPSNYQDKYDEGRS